jgi:hypothetical protein
LATKILLKYIRNEEGKPRGFRKAYTRPSSESSVINFLAWLFASDSKSQKLSRVALYQSPPRVVQGESSG